MERPALSVHVPACMHTDGRMLGSCRTEHVRELKVVIFSGRLETSLSMFLDFNPEGNTNPNYRNLAHCKAT